MKVVKHISPSGNVYLRIYDDDFEWFSVDECVIGERFESEVNTYGWINFIHEVVKDELSDIAAQCLYEQLINDYSHYFGITNEEMRRERIRSAMSKTAVNQYSLDGEFLAKFKSIHSAERVTGVKSSSICECCKGIRKSAGGFKWTY